MAKKRGVFSPPTPAQGIQAADGSFSLSGRGAKGLPGRGLPPQRKGGEGVRRSPSKKSPSPAPRSWHLLPLRPNFAGICKNRGLQRPPGLGAAGRERSLEGRPRDTPPFKGIQVCPASPSAKLAGAEGGRGERLPVPSLEICRLMGPWSSPGIRGAPALRAFRRAPKTWLFPQALGWGGG